MEMKELFEKIKNHFDKGGCVQVCTAYKAWLFKPKHKDMFKLSKDEKSLYMQRGKNWDCINYCAIQFSVLKEN